MEWRQAVLGADVLDQVNVDKVPGDKREPVVKVTVHTDAGSQCCQRQGRHLAQELVYDLAALQDLDHVGDHQRHPEDGRGRPHHKAETDYPDIEAAPVHDQQLQGDRGQRHLERVDQGPGGAVEHEPVGRVHNHEGLELARVRLEQVLEQADDAQIADGAQNGLHDLGQQDHGGGGVQVQDLERVEPDGEESRVDVAPDGLVAPLPSHVALAEDHPVGDLNRLPSLVRDEVSPRQEGHDQPDDHKQRQ